MERKEADYRNLDERYLRQQYSNIYFTRLHHMRTLLHALVPSRKLYNVLWGMSCYLVCACDGPAGARIRRAQWPRLQFLTDPSRGALAGRLALGSLLGSAALLGCHGAALAVAEDSIKASGFGLRVAASLRSLGWPDDAVVFTLATLPVLELRGAISAGYWMRLHPVRLTVLAVLGV